MITNDGALAHELLAPKKHVSKTYEAKIRGEVTQEDVRLFAEGLQVDDDWRALPAKLEVLNTVRIEKNEKTEAFILSTVLLTICEGKFNQVKRMFEVVGKEVVFFMRLCMGPLRLDEDLAVGAYRLLSEEEISSLKNLRMG